ncbi:MAG: rnd [Acidimicrobiia bacterium]|nr:rnd [Acidimicrobiia bacterium]
MGEPHQFIADDRSLQELVDRLVSEPRYAIDTEFHRERTYYPQLALLQVAWSDGLALVDTTVVDIHPLAKVFDGPGLAVLHAAQQDLEVLERECGTVPARLFDTQLAAGFLGHSTPSLANLLAGELGVKMAKGERLTDWLRRPLTAEQLEYAAGDVLHLLELHDKLVAQLEARGRLQWALDECEELRIRPTGPPDPATAWLRLKDHRALRGVSRGVAREVAAWRERRAAELDQPTRFVLADLSILGIAQRPPRTAEDLRKVRGLDDRVSRGDVATQLLEAVARGAEVPAEELEPPRSEELDRHLRPAVTLVSAWVSQLARDQDVDTTLLATRADLTALLRGDAGARLAEGWRAEMVGDGIRRLVKGEASLAFNGSGKLVLEARAGRETS